MFAGDGNGAPVRDSIDYITIASAGNATDFGDLAAGAYDMAGASNNIRGVFGGGSPAHLLVYEYITIASTGNAADFGDPTANISANSACCNGHGALTN